MRVTGGGDAQNGNNDVIRKVLIRVNIYYALTCALVSSVMTQGSGVYYPHLIDRKARAQTG